MFPALLTFAGTKCAGSFASHVIAHAAASIIGNTLVETLKIRFIAEIVRALKQRVPAVSEGLPPYTLFGPWPMCIVKSNRHKAAWSSQGSNDHHHAASNRKTSWAFIYQSVNPGMSP